MEDKRKNNGGHKTNGGRHTKADEAKVNTLFVEGLKRLYNKDTDDENKISFVVTLLESQRGQIFIAEHLFGKPKETVETTLSVSNFDVKDLFKIDSIKPQV
jgi:hypothetical protein